MATDGPPVALQPPNEVIVASARVPEDPLQRLHETMAQTPEGARLRAILQESPPFVRNTTSQALSHEMVQSYQNVVGQLEALAEIRRQIEETLGSEEAAALNDLMREIHPSEIRALRREADGIEGDISDVRRALEAGSIKRVQSRATTIANKARRFRDKYAEVRPKLDKLKKSLDEIRESCRQGAEVSDNLIAEAHQRKDWWWTLLIAVNAVLFLGGVSMIGLATHTAISLVMNSVQLSSAIAAGMAAGASVAVAGTTAGVGAYAAGLGTPVATLFGSELLESAAVGLGLMATPAAPLAPVAAIGAAAAGAAELVWSSIQSSATATAAATNAPASAQVSFIQSTITSLSSYWMSAPFISTACLLLALAALGYVGRDIIKRLLAQLFAGEIQQHERTKDNFLKIEEVVRAAAERLQAVCAQNEALVECVDLVVEAAGDLAAKAEDAQANLREEFQSDLAQLHKLVDKLSSVYAAVPQAFQRLSEPLSDLLPVATAGGAAACPSLGTSPRPVRAQEHILDLEVAPVEVPDRVPTQRNRVEEGHAEAGDQVE